MANDDERPAPPEDAVPARVTDSWVPTAHLESWRGALEWSHQQLLDIPAASVAPADPVDLFPPLCTTCGGTGMHQQRPCAECRT